MAPASAAREPNDLHRLPRRLGASFCGACLALDYHLADCKFYPAVPPLRAEHPLAVMA